MNKNKLILFHYLFWFFDFLKDAVYGFQYYFFYDEQYSITSLYKTTAIDLVRTLLVVVLFYANAQVLVPRFFKKGRYGYYGLGVLLLLLVFTPVFYYFELILNTYFGWYSYGHELTFAFIFQSVLVSSWPYLLLGIAYHYMLGLFKAQEENKALEKAKLSTELAFLKSQINPHFLFNTINDIYALTYKKSDLAPDALLKLSGLLRYMLHESEQAQVPLIKEIDYLQDVVELQRIGLKGNACIEFEQRVQCSGQVISPLILIAFVENAFKHGVCDNPAYPVKVELKEVGNTLYFTVFNRKNKDQKDKTGGIGLANVRRRLELLYPQKHELTIKEDNDSFAVQLLLQLRPSAARAVPLAAESMIATA